MIQHRRVYGFIAAAWLAACSTQDHDHDHGDSGDESELVDLLPAVLATSDFHDPEVARAEGWDLREGLDSCFENEPEGAMGYHYINVDLLDTEVDPALPEAMVYHTGKDGRLRFGAVEWIVPAEAWDAGHHGGPPMVLGRHMHLNAALGVYVMHAWIGKPNPNGMFADWNPDVSCP